MRSFVEAFGYEAEVDATAPGRVNLLGEHTDYNEGFVLPTVTPQRTRVQLGRARGGRFRLFSADLDESVSLAPDEAPREGFALYVHGCIDVVRRRGLDVPPLDLFIASDVPIGVGLSSSAALEVAVLRGLRALLGVALSDIEVAALAHTAEVEYAKVRCGVLDPMACSLGRSGSMLFIDTRLLEVRTLPLPGRVMAIDSGVRRRLSNTAYNARRAECEDAARLLSVTALRDVVDVRTVDALPPPLDRRARHVITENLRVLAALSATGEEFGALMNASHASLRDDFEVSTNGLDVLAGSLQRQPGILGARLTGAGFGGACVALAADGAAAPAAKAALEALRAIGLEGRVLL
jgi:galactokinase